MEAIGVLLVLGSTVLAIVWLIFPFLVLGRLGNMLDALLRIERQNAQIVAALQNIQANTTPVYQEPAQEVG